MSTIRAVDRTFSILRIIANHPKGVGVNNIARKTNLPNSTVSRLLIALEAWEVVERNEENQFHLGPELMRLVGQQPFTQNLTALARPILQEIADITEETVALCILDNMQTYYLDHVQSSQAIRVRDWTGEHLPLHVTAPGKIFLAYGSPDLVETVLTKPLEQYTPGSITKPDLLRLDLERIRAQGYVMSDGEFEDGVLGFGVPIKGDDNEVIAALNLYGPKFRLDDREKQQQIISVLREKATDLAERLSSPTTKLHC